MKAQDLERIIGVLEKKGPLASNGEDELRKYAAWCIDRILEQSGHRPHLVRALPDPIWSLIMNVGLVPSASTTARRTD